MVCDLGGYVRGEPDSAVNHPWERLEVQDLEKGLGEKRCHVGGSSFCGAQWAEGLSVHARVMDGSGVIAGLQDPCACGRFCMEQPGWHPGSCPRC